VGTALCFRPNILKRVIKVDGKSFSVVGVMKKASIFQCPLRLGIRWAEREGTAPRDNRRLWVLGRLKPGVSFFAGSAAEMQALSEGKRKLTPIPIKPGVCTHNRCDNSYRKR